MVTILIPIPYKFQECFCPIATSHDINVSLIGTTISNVSSTILEFKLTEVQRAKLMMFTPRVETGKQLFELNEGAFHDLSGNDVAETHGIPV